MWRLTMRLTLHVGRAEVVAVGAAATGKGRWSHRRARAAGHAAHVVKGSWTAVIQ